MKVTESRRNNRVSVSAPQQVDRQKQEDRQNAQLRFATLYRNTHHDVLRFVARRITTPDALTQAEDITTEAFLIAWRRFSEIPLDISEARAWLFTVARNCMLNEVRSSLRRKAMAVRIANDAATHVYPGAFESSLDTHEGTVAARIDLAAAWAALSPLDQEVIALAAWENLNSEQASKVLGIAASTYRDRLTRARVRLRQLLEPMTFAPHNEHNEHNEHNKHNKPVVSLVSSQTTRLTTTQRRDSNHAPPEPALEPVFSSATNDLSIH